MKNHTDSQCIQEQMLNVCFIVFEMIETQVPIKYTAKTSLNVMLDHKRLLYWNAKSIVLLVDQSVTIFFDKLSMVQVIYQEKMLIICTL